MPLRKDSKSCLSISWWFFQVLIVLVMTSVVIWLALKTNHPVFMITNLLVPAVEKGNSTFQNNNEDIRNSCQSRLGNFPTPTKRIYIYYDDMNITLYSKDPVVIGTNSLPGFYQGDKNTILYEVLVNADHQQLRKGITSDFTDVITVQLETAVRYKILIKKTKHHRMDFEVYIVIGSDRRISGDRDIKLQHMVKR